MVQVSTDHSNQRPAISSTNARTEAEKLATSCLSKDDEEQVLVRSPGTQQSSVQSSGFINNVDQELRPHRSNLPLALYYLSFAPPFNLRSPHATWRDTLAHPYVLYAVGICAAAISGTARPILNLIYGYWSTGMLEEDATPKELTGRGVQVAWIMTIVGPVIFLCSWAFLACCEYYNFVDCSDSQSAFDSPRGVSHLV
jgi:hypothetical protein